MRISTVILFGIVTVGCSDSAPENVSSQGTATVASEVPAAKEVVGAFSEKEVAVYAAAFRYSLYRYSGGGNGVIFLGIGDDDAPPELLGRIFRPASRAHLVKGEDPVIPPPGERIRDKVTGEPGSIITVKIIEWIGNERVKIECESYTAPLWACGCRFFLRFDGGEWVDDGEEPDSGWVS